MTTASGIRVFDSVTLPPMLRCTDVCSGAACLQPPDQQQLRKDGAALEDARKLAELRIENDDVLALCFKLEGGLTGFKVHMGVILL